MRQDIGKLWALVLCCVVLCCLFCFVVLIKKWENQTPRIWVRNKRTDLSFRAGCFSVAKTWIQWFWEDSEREGRSGKDFGWEKKLMIRDDVGNQKKKKKKKRNLINNQITRFNYQNINIGVFSEPWSKNSSAATSSNDNIFKGKLNKIDRGFSFFFQKKKKKLQLSLGRENGGKDKKRDAQSYSSLSWGREEGDSAWKE